MLGDLKLIKDRLVQMSRLMVGIPDYDAYVAHRMVQHPDEPIMTYEEFFRNRQDARYGVGGDGSVTRCC
ncbi:YbdD/YjiX family protein [Magnetospirillum aberrantis]|uniref:YbdD/YjiX family protein n=1 Tax=Magnetospirillum aberrantis SpK TaxID=908842 RepID=A0A7C9UWW6_9PROT|nr:CstA-like transporter-associated (seleno)protein [Magnetospirillum aberrantis]NFV81886.1 YbdD/YjiX family protein [Magnetospirillum aberrantis SpK]